MRRQTLIEGDFKFKKPIDFGKYQHLKAGHHGKIQKTVEVSSSSDGEDNAGPDGQPNIMVIKEPDEKQIRIQ